MDLEAGDSVCLSQAEIEIAVTVESLQALCCLSLQSVEDQLNHFL